MLLSTNVRLGMREPGARDDLEHRERVWGRRGGDVLGPRRSLVSP